MMGNRGKLWVAGILVFMGLGTRLPATDVWDTSTPGLAYLHRTTATPWDIHVLLVDLKQPGIHIQTLLSHDRIYGREVVSQMALRHGMTAAVNADFSSMNNGIPQGLTVIDNVIGIAPKFRTAIGFSRNKAATVGMWTDRWNWYATVRDDQGNSHDLVMMNLDVNPDWLCLFTDLYGHPTPGITLGGEVVEVLVGADSLVQSIRHNQAGLTIPPGSWVLTGRGTAANWLLQYVGVGEALHLDLETLPDWHNLWQAVSGGPRFVAGGVYYADPMAPFPGGEDFEMSYKNTYYNSRQPRSAAGVTVNGDTLILAVVDGRQGSSAGMTLHELANLMIEFGAEDAVQFDSGGSATFFLNGSVRNSPSDGSERPIANALGVQVEGYFLNIAPQATILAFSDEALPEHPVSRLIDGDHSRSSGKWADLTSEIPWVELDLGAVYPVTHYQLYHAFYSGDPDYLNTREFRILTRVDSTLAWTEDFHVLNDPYPERDNLCQYATPMDVRFVRLEILQSNHLDYEDYLRQPEFSIYVADPDWTGLETPIRPEDLWLSPAFPNPFNPQTTLRFSVPQGWPFTLSIYDLRGRSVRELASGVFAGDDFQLTWDCRDDSARELGAGLYIAVLRSGPLTVSRKMTLLR